MDRIRAWPRWLQAVAGVAAMAAGVAAWLTVGRPGSGLPPPPELSMPRAVPADAGGGTAGAGLEEAHVHVAGAVVRPGVYRVPGDARVTAVLDAAGGPAADADVDQLNLAARVRDGERIYVPRRGELPPPAPGAGAGGGGGGGGGSPPIDLNAATLEQLDSLPGVGPSTAQAILDERQRRGRFRSVDDLLDVRGIGEARLAQIRPRVRV